MGIIEDGTPQTPGPRVHTGPYAGHLKLIVAAQMWVLEVEWITHARDTQSTRQK